MKRHLITQYSTGEKILKINRSSRPDTAIMNAVGRLQTDEYGATYAIIYDPEKGVDHAIFKRTPMRIEVLYKRKVRKPE